MEGNTGRGRTAGRRPRAAGRRQVEQGLLPFHRNGRRGGARPGAGRKPKADKDRGFVPHRARARLASRYPSHVTVRLVAGLPRLRDPKTYRLLRRCFRAGCERFGFRLVHYSVQGNHLHLITEAKDRAAQSRGMQGLLIRIAKALNKLWERKGRVFAERFHEHVLRSPREVRHALCYVLNNVRRHLRNAAVTLDKYCSGWWFDGWRQRLVMENVPEQPTALARTWLLTTGWRRHGRIGIEEVPG